MDSRIDPLRMLGLKAGDAKIFRNPGGRVTEAALEALVLGAHLLGVDRILVIPHTRCAMASSTEQELRDRVGDVRRAGRLLAALPRGRGPAGRASPRTSPRCAPTRWSPSTVLVGGFIYDVDTGPAGAAAVLNRRPARAPVR